MLFDIDVQLYEYAEPNVFGADNKMMVLIIGYECCIDEAIAGA
jgi:hypothetical protein